MILRTRFAFVFSFLFVVAVPSGKIILAGTGQLLPGKKSPANQRTNHDGEFSFLFLWPAESFSLVEFHFILSLSTFTFLAREKEKW